VVIFVLFQFYEFSFLFHFIFFCFFLRFRVTARLQLASKQLDVARSRIGEMKKQNGDDQEQQLEIFREYCDRKLNTLVCGYL
jgi:hypothetical protein